MTAPERRHFAARPDAAADAGRRGGSSTALLRGTCPECGLVSSPGALGWHRKVKHPEAWTPSRASLYRRARVARRRAENGEGAAEATPSPALPTRSDPGDQSRV